MHIYKRCFISERERQKETLINICIEKKRDQYVIYVRGKFDTEERELVIEMSTYIKKTDEADHIPYMIFKY